MNHVFRFDDKVNCRLAFAQYVKEYLPEKPTVAHQDEIFEDDLSWLHQYVEVDALAESFASFYSGGITAFHGCRPVDISSYLSRGIVPATTKQLKAQVRGLMPDISEDAIESAFLEESYVNRHASEPDHIYAVLDEDSLPTFGSYLIEGSETLQCLKIPGIQAALRQKGIPTIFEFVAPLSSLKPNSLRELIGSVTADFFAMEWFGAERDSHIGYTVIFQGRISAKSITKHTHPEYIRDFRNVGLKYQNRTLTCEYCA